MATQHEHTAIVVERSRRRTRVSANGPAAVRILDALANGAPSFEAAAFGAWIEGSVPIPDEVKVKKVTT
ncbi:hypothetical protein [Ralstonia syzygii]|uniref:hypothetical protein n=1 Tax=Ralstonia syzygii TaxID=28097 RepID=UPI003513C5F6